MKMPNTFVFTCAALVLGALGLPADEVTKAAKIEDLLTAMHAQTMIAKSQEQMETMMHQILIRSTPTLEGTPQLKDVEQLMHDEVSGATKWEVLKPDFVKAYASTFSEDEIDGLLKFYQSPMGQEIVDKMPVVQAQVIQITQQRMQVRLPEIQKKMQELIEKGSTAGKPQEGH